MMRVLFLVFCAGCSGFVTSPDWPEPSAIRPAPLFDGETQPSPSVQTPNHLDDYGGPKLHDLKLVAVALSPAVRDQDRLPAYYHALAEGSYLEVLGEYLPGGVKGKFLGLFVDDRPPPGAELTDEQIGAELNRLIDAGKVPANDGDTVYVIHLWPGLSAVDPMGGHSCVDFCGYHWSRTRGTSALRYAVISDMSTPGCDRGCLGRFDDGTITQAGFTSSTITTSHEVAETITDPNVGLYVAGDHSQLGWYDADHGEIGDICLASIASVDGYVMQKEWSNLAGECRIRPAHPIEVNVSSPVVHLASHGTQDVKVSISGDTREPIALTLDWFHEGGTGPRATLDGVSAHLDFSTVSVGDSISLRLSADVVDHLQSDSLQITATSGDQISKTSIEVRREPDSQYDLQLLPHTLLVPRGGSARVQISPALAAGVAHPLQITAVAPAGTTAEIYFSTITVGQTDFLILKVAADAPLSMPELVVRASDGSSYSEGRIPLLIEDGPPAPSAAPYHCPAGASLQTNDEDGMYCLFDNLPIPTTVVSPDCDWSHHSLGYSWDDLTSPLACGAGATALDANDVDSCHYDASSAPPSAQPYCDYVQQGYIGYSWSLCPSGWHVAGNGANDEFCTYDLVPPDGTQAYCDYLSSGTIGFYYPLATGYQCPSGFEASTNGAGIGFCLIHHLAIPAELKVDPYCMYIQMGYFGFSWLK